jgi:hypothetical protein
MSTVYQSEVEKAAEAYRVLQAKRLIDAFTKAKGYAPTNLTEFTEWVIEIGPGASTAIADGVDA